jgi:hypothetical protein
MKSATRSAIGGAFICGLLLLVIGLEADAAEPVVWLAQGGDHGVFGKPDWRLATIAAADRFLVDRGFLTGESTLPLSPGGKTLTPAGADSAP